jgi:Divergent InlB B-repeat domain
VRTSLLASVEGNGSIVTVSSSRGLSGKPPRQPVKCGVKGTACLSEVPPGGTMTMKAIPAPGYKFAGWNDGCTGLSTTCTFKAGGSVGTGSVSAMFAPVKRNRALAIKLRTVAIKATFKASVGKGALRVNGRITLPARLRIQLRRPGGGPLVTRNIRAAGSFGLRSLLRKGKLARGAQLFPGAFVLSLTGKAGNTPVPLQMKTIFVKSPREGVVRKAYPSTTEDGPRVNPIPRGSTQLWAVFRFETQPTTGPITASWYDLKGKFVGTITKNNRPMISTGIGAPGALAAGTYKVVLKAGGKLIKTVRIKVA